MGHLNLWHALVAAITLASGLPSAAQELPTPFARKQTGDASLLGGDLSVLRTPTVNSSGQVFHSARDTSTGEDFIWTEDRVVLREGPVSGASQWNLFAISTFYARATDGGVLWSQGSVTDGNGAYSTLLFRDSEAVFLPGQACLAPGAPSGSVYQTLLFGGVLSVDDQRCIAAVAIRPPQGQARKAVVEFRTDSQGAILAEEIRMIEGARFNGRPATINRILGMQFHSNAWWTIIVENSTSTTPGGVVMLTSTGLELRPGDPAPFPGRTWASLGGGTIGVNGDYAHSGVLDDGKIVIVKNGQPFAHEDDIPVDLKRNGAPVGSMNVHSISPRGRVAWSIVMDEPFGPHLRAYMVEKKPTFVFNGTAIDGTSFTGGWAPGSFDGQGVYAGVALGYFTPFGVVQIGLVLPLDQSESICSNGPSSIGRVPQLTVHGSPKASDGADLEILTQGMPPRTMALTLASTETQQVADPFGSTGSLCIGPTVSRSPALRASGLGVTRTRLSALGAATGSTPQAGDTWYFQTWYRDEDPNTGAASSRWTEAVSVQFD